MPGEPQEDQPVRRVTFDPTFNLGHILTLMGLMASVWVSWSTLDKRIVVLEESGKLQTQVDRHQDEVMRMNMTTIRESLLDIKQTLTRTTERLERKE